MRITIDIEASPQPATRSALDIMAIAAALAPFASAAWERLFPPTRCPHPEVEFTPEELERMARMAREADAFVQRGGYPEPPAPKKPTL
jgi:hypothetical protein